MIGSFGLAICLRVIGSADILLDAYLGTDNFGELGCQLRISIQNDFLWDAIVWKDMLKIDLGQFLGPHGFLARDELYHLGTVMIGNSKDRVVSQ